MGGVTIAGLTAQQAGEAADALGRVLADARHYPSYVGDLADSGDADLAKCQVLYEVLRDRERQQGATKVPA